MDVTIEDVTLDRDINQPSPYVSGIYAVKNGAGDVSLTLNRSRVAGHTWTGVYGEAASLSINDSTIESNSSPGSGGGVVEVPNDNRPTGAGMLINHCTISGNVSLEDGGGIWWSGNVGHVNNSTVSGNVASRHGGGIYFKPPDQGAYFQIAFSTVALNSASQRGGGVMSPMSAEKDQTSGSIFAYNSATQGAEWYGFVQNLENSLVFHIDATMILPDPTNPPSSASTNINNMFNVDPRLDTTLRDLGGNHLKMHNPLSGSPVIDYVSDVFQGLDQTDTAHRPRGIDGNGFVVGKEFDIGGCERQGL